jgi:hypothetical protein
MASRLDLQSPTYLSDNQALVTLLNGSDFSSPPDWRVKTFTSNFITANEGRHHSTFQIGRKLRRRLVRPFQPGIHLQCQRVTLSAVWLVRPAIHHSGIAFGAIQFHYYITPSTIQTIKSDILPFKLFKTGQITLSSSFGGWFYLFLFLIYFRRILKNHNKSKKNHKMEN